MASLIRRNNGIYYMVTCKRRKRVWRSLFTRDEMEAQRICSTLTDNGRKSKIYTLSDFWKEAQEIIKAECSPRTLEIYACAVNNFLRVIGDKRLVALTVLDCERFKLARCVRVKKLTVNKELRTIRALLGRAVQMGFLESNVAKRCPTFRIDNCRPTFLVRDDVMRLLKVISDRCFIDIVLFALNTAMRAGEIVYLEWPDVDYASRQILITNKPGHRVKTGKERMVPMNDIVFEILHRCRKNGLRVFTDKVGAPLKVKTISDRFRKSRLKAGLPQGVRFHSLRHTSLTWMHHNGVPVESLRQIAGHSSIQTTQIYTHALPEHLLAAANTLSRLSYNLAPEVGIRNAVNDLSRPVAGTD
ncbi:MAG: tyrosine-type recombinase/integrase [Bacteroidota bacterium]